MKDTKRNRLNITLSKDIQAFLKVVAEEDGVPIATKATELLKESMAAYEDRADLEALEKREKETTKWISHNEVWG